MIPVIIVGAGLAGLTAAWVLHAAGLPVFAGTPAHGIGLVYMAGPTGGYLAGEFAAVILVSSCIDRLRPAFRPLLLLAGMVVIYMLGAAWLSTLIGAKQAWTLGVLPFLFGDAIKLSIASAAVLLRRTA